MFREAAGAVDQVLSDMVARVTKRLRVEAGRLVCDTDRGAELLSDLSGGERWRLAVEIAAEQVGQGGLVTVPQEAWEGLDPQNRAEVAEIARRVGVVLLTAECSENSEIAAEVV
jgi:ABC-type multidrug transport system ATPase subunit